MGAWQFRESRCRWVKPSPSREISATVYEIPRSALDQANGWVTSQTIDPGGLNIVTQCVYDNATGWLKKVISCGSCSGAGTTEYVRDSRGNVVRQRSGGASDPWTQFYYDAQSRLTRVDSPFADGGSTATTYFSYDAWGNRLLVTDPANKATSFTYEPRAK